MDNPQIPPLSSIPQASLRHHARRLVILLAFILIIFGGTWYITHRSEKPLEKKPKIALYAVRKDFYDFVYVRENYEQAIAKGEALMREYPDDFYIAQLTANAYRAKWFKTLDDQMLERAEKLLEIAVQKNPEGAGVFNDVRLTKALLLKEEEGILFFQEQLYKFPDLAPRLHLYIGDLYDQAGNREEAQRYLSLALKEDPNQSFAHFLLSRLAVGDQGDAAIAAIRFHATRAIETASTTDPWWALGHAMLAESYLFEKKYQKAAEIARKGIANNPLWCAACHHMLGDALLGLYQEKNTQTTLEESIDEQEKAVNISPLASHPYYSLGVGYLLRGDRKKAIATWQKGLQYLSRDPHYPGWYKPQIEKELRQALEDPERIKTEYYL